MPLKITKKTGVSAGQPVSPVRTAPPPAFALPCTGSQTELKCNWIELKCNRTSVTWAVEVGLRRDRLVVSNPGGRFTVVLEQPATTRPGNQLNETELRIYDALANGERSVAELQQMLDLSSANIRKVLRELRARGLVEQIGGRGRPTRYRRPPE